MHIRELVRRGRTYSFEFFPPKTPDAEAALERALGELEPLRPSFVSVTYGAGGSTRERTHDIVVSINRDTTMTAMAHLTCAGHSRAELGDILTAYRGAGVDNILALAGDPPKDADVPEGEFRYALQLVELVRQVGDFSVGVAAHPEKHPRSPDMVFDRDRLAEKLRSADFAITQFFFKAAPYLSMVDELAARGVHTPVIPGIMPVTNAGQIKRFAELAGAEFPADLAARVASAGEDPSEVRKVGVELATQLCTELLDAGVPGLHFYTLNRSTATREIYANLGLAPDSASPRAAG